MRHHLPILAAVLVLIPLMGGVQQCGGAPPATSGEQQPDGSGTTTTGPADTGSPAAGTEQTAAADNTVGPETAQDVTTSQPAADTAKTVALREFEEGKLALDVAPPQLPTAIDRFEKVTLRMPEWAEGHFNLGIAYYRNGDTVKAIAAFEKATVKDPKMGAAWAMLGQCYERQKRSGAALDAYSQCKQNDPENTDCRLGIVRLDFDNGDIDETIRRVREILRINSTSVGAYIMLSQAYMRKGDLNLARFALDKAKRANELAELNPTLHCNLGMIYREKEMDYEAKLEWERALQLDPDHVQTLVNLANLMLLNLDHEGATTLAARAVKNDPSHIGARLALGLAKRGTGDLNGAVAEFQYVLDNNPNDKDALFNLAVLYGDYSREWDKAIDAYNSLLGRLSSGPERQQVEVYLDEVQKNKERESKNIEREQRRKEEDARRAAEAEAQRLADEQAARAAAAEAAAAEEAARAAQAAAAAAAAAAAEEAAAGGASEMDGSEGNPAGGEVDPSAGTETTPEPGDGG